MREMDTVTLAELPLLLKPSEAAKALRRATRTIRRWDREGKLRAVRIAGGQPMYPRAEIERLINEAIDQAQLTPQTP